MTVAEGSQAGRDVIIKDVYIDVHEVDPAGRERVTIKQLCDALRQALDTRRVALVFINTHETDSRTLTSLSRDLWDDALGTLLSSGLLAIDIADYGIFDGTSSAWPPAVSYELLDDSITLPDMFDDDTRSHAVEDFTAFVLEKGWFATPGDAKIVMDGVTRGSRTIQEMHSRIASVIAGVRSGIAS